VIFMATIGQTEGSSGSRVCDIFEGIMSDTKDHLTSIENKLEMVFGPMPPSEEPEKALIIQPDGPFSRVEFTLLSIKRRAAEIHHRLNDEL